MLANRRAESVAGILLLLVQAAALVGCSRSLDRATAEELIQNNNQLGVSNVEFRLRSPLFVDNLPGMYGRMRSPNDQTRFDLEFAKALHGAGIVAWWAEVRSQVGNGGAFGTFIEQPFTGISQDFVEWRPDRNPSGTLVLTLATPELRGVTGVTQEESEAVAEAEVGLKVTGLYEKIEPLVRDLLVRCGSLKIGSQVCQSWPTQERLDSTQKVSYGFTRFDDGWRLAN